MQRLAGRARFLTVSNYSDDLNPTEQNLFLPSGGIAKVFWNIPQVQHRPEDSSKRFFERKSMDNLFQMWWPVACVVLADVIYQVCAKKISSGTDPLAALGVTYLVSAAVCTGLYYGMGGMDLLADMSHVRLAAAGIGFAVTGLEVGCVYMYKAGWAMNVGFILYTAMIVAALLVVGAVFYGEAVSFTAIAGLIITSSGMYMIVRGA